MMFELRKTLVFAIALGFAATSLGACERDAVEVQPPALTLVGKNVCLGCSLKGSDGAQAQCSAFGHTHALEIRRAIGPNDEELPRLVGQTVHYLQNDQSAALVKGEEYHGELVQVHGRLFGSASTLEVKEFPAPSDELSTAAGDAPKDVHQETREVVLIGQNECLGCSLKGSDKAASQCSDFGHTHTLRVEKAQDAEGQTLDEFIGRRVHYLANDKSAPLLKGEEFHGDRVQVKGRLFANSATLEVAEFAAPQ
ncbi:MAG: hypothetical protein ACNA8W_05335 [Bradymonadaceae bacterium]